MKFVKPKFYDSFKCTASKCTDTCCAGWEVDIDDISLSRYEKFEGKFGDRIRENIVRPKIGESYFRLKENERCVFLDDNNLCEIIKNCGEGYLCDICKLHPRFFNWLPERTEAGLGLCCEEVCRMIYENSEKLSFICEEDEDTDDDGYDEYSDEEKILSREVISARDEVIKVLQNSDFSFEQRGYYAMQIVKNAQKRLFGIDCEESNVNDLDIVALMEKTDPIDEQWSPLVSEIKDNLAKIRASERAYDKQFSERAFEQENLCMYYLYRYLVKSFFDGELFKRNLFCYRCVRFIKLMNMNTYLKTGEFTVKDNINNTKYFSKQIEYSEENIEILTFD